MLERHLITYFVAGALFGFSAAAIIAGWLWVHFSEGWPDKPPTNKERDEKLIENMIEEEQ
jgi:hypothetical protein